MRVGLSRAAHADPGAQAPSLSPEARLPQKNSRVTPILPWHPDPRVAVLLGTLPILAGADTRKVTINGRAWLAKATWRRSPDGRVVLGAGGASVVVPTALQ